MQVFSLMNRWTTCYILRDKKRRMSWRPREFKRILVIWRSSAVDHWCFVIHMILMQTVVCRRHLPSFKSLRFKDVVHYYLPPNIDFNLKTQHFDHLSTCQQWTYWLSIKIKTLGFQFLLAAITQSKEWVKNRVSERGRHREREREREREGEINLNLHGRHLFFDFEERFIAHCLEVKPECQVPWRRCCWASLTVIIGCISPGLDMVWQELFLFVHSYWSGFTGETSE